MKRLTFSWRSALLFSTAAVIGALMALQLSSLSIGSALGFSSQKTIAPMREIRLAIEQNAALSDAIVYESKTVSVLQNAKTRKGGLETALIDSKKTVGDLPVSGSGVTIFVAVPLSAADAALLINELWRAGATALSVGAVRLTPEVIAIESMGELLLVGGVQIAAPFSISAIGSTLSAAKINALPVVTALQKQLGNASVVISSLHHSMPAR